MAGQNRRLRQRLRRAVSSLAGKPEIRSTPLPPSRPPPARAPGAHLSLRSQAPHLYPDRASLAASADPQENSPFFAALPAEVRHLIYASMWRTGAHVHGIHVECDRWADRLASAPCVLGHEEMWGAAAGVNAELDVLFAARGVDGTGRGGVEVSREQLGELAERVERTHGACDDDGVDGARNAARFRTGADPLVLWSPFLPVLLTCKRV